MDTEKNWTVVVTDQEWRTGGKIFCRGNAQDGFAVGFIRERPDNTDTYRGPVAEVSADKDWLVINTDSYEGYAMLNVEALPALRHALSLLARHLKKHKSQVSQ